MLLTVWMLLSLVNLRCSFRQAESICHHRCYCTAVSAICKGDNNTFVDVVGSLPNNTRTFIFILATQDRHSTIYIDEQLCGSIGRLNDLITLQIRPESQDQSFRYRLTITKQCPTCLCNLTNLRHLHLNVRTDGLSADTIQCLRVLTLLDLSYVQDLWGRVLSILNVSLSENIDKVLVRNVQTFLYGIETFHFSIFHDAYRCTVRVLDLADNTFTSLSPDLWRLPNLKKLDLSGNLLFFASWQNRLTGFEIVFHPSLQEIRVTDQGIKPVRDTFHVYRYTTREQTHTDHSGGLSFSKNPQGGVLPSLLTFDSKLNRGNQDSRTISASGCLYNVVFPLGKNIRLLNVSGFSASDPYPYENPVAQGRICFNPNNNLQIFDASRMELSRFLERPKLGNLTITGLNKLHWINLEYNRLSLSLQASFFAGFPSLRTLLLSKNLIQLDGHNKGKLPHSLEKLTTLDLSDNQLKYIPYYEFSNLSLETLSLGGNLLQELNFTFPPCGSLRMLNISSNKFSSLNGTMTRQMDAYGRLEVDIQNNQLVCGCHTLDFVYWVQNTHVTLTGKENLSCFTDLGLVPIKNINFHQLYKRCSPLTTVQIALITASTTVCCLCLIVLTRHLYRRRWRIRYFWYRRRLQRMRAERRMEDNYEHDAFVSWSGECAETRVWLQTHLERELEEKRGLRLFISERDMDYGRCLLRDIDDKMATCRKAILVLSPEYLTSWECLYEAWSVHATMVAEDRDAAIVVRMQALPIAGIPGTLTRLLEMRECFSWTEDPEGQELFWERLYDALLLPGGNPVNE